MIDLFSVVLTSGIGWGVGKLLDSVVSCRRGHSQQVNVTNVTYNGFSCRVCNQSLSEYVNATGHTVKRNRAVVAAGLYNIHWPDWRNTFEMYYSLDVVNSSYEEVVVELILSRFNGVEFCRYPVTLTPNYEYTYWHDNWIRIDGSSFPKEAGPIALELRTYNVWGDLLDQNRRVMNYHGK